MHLYYILVLEEHASTYLVVSTMHIVSTFFSLKTIFRAPSKLQVPEAFNEDTQSNASWELLVEGTVHILNISIPSISS